MRRGLQHGDCIHGGGAEGRVGPGSQYQDTHALCWPSGVLDDCVSKHGELEIHVPDQRPSCASAVLCDMQLVSGKHRGRASPSRYPELVFVSVDG